MVSFYDNSLISSFINRTGRDLSLNSWDSDPHVGFGSHELIGGGMLFGPTEGSILSSLVGGGYTGGSRAILSGMTRWTGLGEMGGMNYAQGAMGGIVAGSNHFAFGGGPLWAPLPIPVFHGMMPAPAPSTSAAAAPAASAPASTLSASTPSDVDADRDAEEISDLRESYENAEHGYTDDEMSAILDAAEEASGEDSAKFKRILKDLPDKKFEEKFDDEGKPVGPSIDQQRAGWAKNFGQWYAEKIGGVDGGKAAQLVKDVASGEGVTYDLELAKNKKAFKKYTVKGVDGQGELEDGDALYYNPKDNKFYASFSKKEGFTKPVGKASEPVKDGKKTKKSVSLEIGGGVDYIELTPAGVHEGKFPKEDDGHTKLYDRFVVGETVGEESHEKAKDIQKKDGEYYIFYNADKDEWVYDPMGEANAAVLGDVEYVDGRLYFNKGGSYDADLADNAEAYMKKLDTAADELEVRLDKIETASEEQDQLRAEAAIGQLTTLIEKSEDGKETVKKVEIGYSAKEDTLTVTCDKDDCGDVVKALEGTHEVEGRDGEINEYEKAVSGEAILSELPKKTQIVINPDSELNKPFSTKVKPFEKLVEGLRSEDPAPIKIEKEISLGHLKGVTSTTPAEAVTKHLKHEIEQQNKKIHNPEGISFEKEVKLPEGVTKEEWESGIKDIQEGYGSTGIKFAKVTFADGESYEYDFQEGGVVSGPVKGNSESTDEAAPAEEGEDVAEASAEVSSDEATETNEMQPAESAAGIGDSDKAFSEEKYKVEAKKLIDDFKGDVISKKVFSNKYNALLFKLDKEKDSDALYNQLLARKHYALGHVHYTNGKYKKAIKQFRKAFEADENPEVFEAIAESKKKLGDYDGAIKEYEEILDSEVAGEELKEMATKRIALIEESIAKDEDATASTVAETKPATKKSGSGKPAKGLAFAAPDGMGDKHDSGSTTKADDGEKVAESKAKPEPASEKPKSDKSGEKLSFAQPSSSPAAYGSDAKVEEAAPAAPAAVESAKAEEVSEADKEIAFFDKNYDEPVKKKTNKLVKKFDNGMKKEKFVEEYDLQIHHLTYGIGLLEDRLEAGHPKIAEAQKKLDKTIAKKEYALGKDYFSKGKYAEAEAEFQSAYDKTKNKDCLLAIASCKKKQGAYEGAIEVYKKILADDSVSAKYKKKVSGLMAKAEAKKAKLDKKAAEKLDSGKDDPKLSFGAPKPSAPAYKGDGETDVKTSAAPAAAEPTETKEVAAKDEPETKKKAADKKDSGKSDEKLSFGAPKPTGPAYTGDKADEGDDSLKAQAANAAHASDDGDGVVKTAAKPEPAAPVKPAPAASEPAPKASTGKGFIVKGAPSLDLQDADIDEIYFTPDGKQLVEYNPGVFKKNVVVVFPYDDASKTVGDPIEAYYTKSGKRIASMSPADAEAAKAKIYDHVQEALEFGLEKAPKIKKEMQKAVKKLEGADNLEDFQEIEEDLLETMMDELNIEQGAQLAMESDLAKFSGSPNEGDKIDVYQKVAGVKIYHQDDESNGVSVTMNKNSGSSTDFATSDDWDKPLGTDTEPTPAPVEPEKDGASTASAAPEVNGEKKKIGADGSIPIEPMTMPGGNADVATSTSEPMDIGLPGVDEKQVEKKAKTADYKKSDPDDPYYASWGEMRAKGLKDAEVSIPFLLAGEDGQQKVEVVSKYKIPKGDDKMARTLLKKKWKLVPDQLNPNYLLVVGSSKVYAAAKKINNSEMKKKFLEMFDYKVA